MSSKPLIVLAVWHKSRLLWHLLWLFACMGLEAAVGASEPVFLVGTVGQAKVQMQLSTNAHTVGSYCYLKSTGGWLRLNGTNQNGRIQLAESPEQKPGQATGRWDGRFTNGTFAGTWSSPDGKRKLPFSLRQAAPPPQSSSALAKPKLSASTAPQTTHAPAVSKSRRPAVDREMEEARRRFCYEGQAINPGLIKRLNPWLSDSTPINLEVDLAAGQHSNEFFDPFTVGKDGWVVLPQKDEEGRQSSFSYRHLGGMTNGVQVLWVNDWGGGSGVFMSLLFIRFSRGTGYIDGQPYEQLSMRCDGHQVLGDRYKGDVKVLPDRVRIFPPPDEDGKPEKPVDVRIE